MKVLTYYVLALTLVGIAMAPKSKASEFDKKTIMTFSEPVQIPGAVLGAGTYVIQRADPGGNPDVVRFMSSDSMHTYATVLTIPAERGTPPNKPEVTFAETRGGTPQAIKKWWYPGEITGEEFVYPKGSQLMARNTGLEMPAQRAETVPTPAPAAPPEPEASVNEPAPAPAVENENNEPVEMAQNTVPPSPPANTNTNTNTPPPDETRSTLPHTASDIPLLAMLGALLLVGGIGLKAFSREKAREKA